MGIVEDLKREYRVHYLSQKIKKLKSVYKIALSEKLGISYFTLIGKSNGYGGYSDKQLTLIEEWLNESERKHGATIYKRPKKTGEKRPRYNREGFGRRKRVLHKRMDKAVGENGK